MPVRSVRWTRRAPILDQGSIGSCTGNAAAGWLGTDDLDQRGRADITEAFAVGLYSAATRLDPWDGEYPPDDTGSDGLSVCKVLQARGLIGSYTHCFGLTDLLTALQSGPVLVGTPWYDGMFDPGPRGLVTVSGAVVGGHEYLAVGVDVERQEVVFAQSWGDGWGEVGYFRMAYTAVARLLGEDGDATVPHAPVPAEPDGPVPSRSWWRRFADWFFGLFTPSRDPNSQ